MKFADTGWWVAWALPGDVHHNAALEMLEHLGGNEKVLTTNLVAGEAWTFLRRRDRHATAVGFLDRLAALEEQGRLVVHRVTDEQEAAAWAWLRDHDQREYSFVDATSFRVMADRRLREAFAFDDDFAAAGFIELKP